MFDLTPFDRHEHRMQNWFDRDWNDMFRMLSAGEMRTDIEDHGDHYEMNAEMPGLDKKDIQVRIKGDYLLINAEHHTDKKDERKDYVCHERHYSQYSRSFNIHDIDREGIKVNYRNGVLQVLLPKAETKPDKDEGINLTIED